MRSIPFDPDQALRLVADDWFLLRTSDIYRLLDSYPEHRAEILARLVEQRPDLRRHAECDLREIEQGEEAFSLANDPPKHIPKRFEDSFNTLQRQLITGLDCLPGQGELFDA